MYTIRSWLDRSNENQTVQKFHLELGDSAQSGSHPPWSRPRCCMLDSCWKLLDIASYVVAGGASPGSMAWYETQSNDLAQPYSKVACMRLFAPRYSSVAIRQSVNIGLRYAFPI